MAYWMTGCRLNEEKISDFLDLRLELLEIFHRHGVRLLHQLDSDLPVWFEGCPFDIGDFADSILP